jgi:hypothetical protein
MATVIEKPRRKKQASAAVVCGGRSVTMVDERMQVNVPSWVVDLASPHGSTGKERSAW